MPRVRHAHLIVGGLTLLAIVAALMLPAMPQDPSYHHFADTTALGGWPNGWNVLSNLPFVLVGAFGLWRWPQLAEPACRPAYGVLCVGVMLVGLGSSYYHWAPSTSTLFWDRLPMTIAFMAMLALVLDECLPGLLGKGRSSLWPLLVLGWAAVGYWAWSEHQGHGDLRPYGLVQFLPMLLLPVLLALYPRRYLRVQPLLLAFGFYVLAKILEHFDAAVWAATQQHLSGHSLKHFSASVATLGLVWAVPKRREPMQAAP